MQTFNWPSHVLELRYFFRASIFAEVRVSQGLCIKTQLSGFPFRAIFLPTSTNEIKKLTLTSNRSWSASISTASCSSPKELTHAVPPQEAVLTLKEMVLNASPMHIINLINPLSGVALVRNTSYNHKPFNDFYPTQSTTSNYKTTKSNYFHTHVDLPDYHQSHIWSQGKNSLPLRPSLMILAPPSVIPQIARLI